MEFHRFDIEKLQADTPGGYTIPAAALSLLELADAQGWQTAAAWAMSHDDSPFLTVEVATADRSICAAITWHSYYERRTNRRLRIISKKMRAQGRWNYAFSLKSLREMVIAS